MEDPALYKALVEYLIKDGEGFETRQYDDTRGYKTIGYGFNQDDPSVRKVVGSGTQMSREQADAILPHFISRAENDAKSYMGPMFDRLDPNRRAVLVDMAYNLGGPKLGGFVNMRKALLEGNYDRAGRELQNSNYFKQVKRRGVRNRDLMAGRTMARFKPE